MVQFLFPPPDNTQAVNTAIPATEHMQEVTVLADTSYLSFKLDKSCLSDRKLAVPWHGTNLLNSLKAKLKPFKDLPYIQGYHFDFKVLVGLGFFVLQATSYHLKHADCQESLPLTECTPLINVPCWEVPVHPMEPVTAPSRFLDSGDTHPPCRLVACASYFKWGSWI